MKKKHLALLLGTATLLSSVSSFAADGTANIKFTGSIVTTGCTVKINSKSNDETIDLGSIDLSGVATGTTSPVSTPVSLKFSDCPSGASSASVTFSGTPGSNSTSSFDVNGENSGKIALDIYDQNGLVVAPNKPAPTQVGINNGSGEMDYTVLVEKASDDVKQTTFDVSTAINIAYE
jgi:type 1 fimbria pilin